ncbi:MAG: UDP-N-acetylmuramoyl-L-alanyl-D-glutamate--2,6-diaminopimelate ligase [Rhodospirillales bacterium]|nr:UDP-N-acetylmuramoyl-L-alanyl-D-glutamate--2,6-diaminopimelate ligase [Rhodospirillales bacterium]
MDLLDDDAGHGGVSGDSRVEIAGLASDSRAVKPGFLFAALPGTRADGRAFIRDAIAKGATAILTSSGANAAPADIAPAGAEVAWIRDPNPRRRLALLASRFFRNQPRIVVAVTGTNGKTSVVRFVRHIWYALGLSGASIGTLGVSSEHLNQRGNLTTPDPVSLHRALVTNLTRDHLDYHGSAGAYLAAKLRLFEELVTAGGTAVVNADSAQARVVREAARRRGLRVVTYGSAEGSDLRLQRLAAVEGGQDLTLSVFGERHHVALPLAGDFQASNAVAALGLVLAAGADVKRSVAALATLPQVPGRLERVARLSNGASIYVDYAHTPDALAAVLRAARADSRGRLVVLFGCGGDRDAGKRPEMGAIAAEFADRVIVTDDNPRSEDPAAIRRQILEGCPAAVEVAGRGEAIEHAVASLAEGDILVVAGKGHETGQIIGDVVHSFEDAAVVRAAAARYGT